MLLFQQPHFHHQEVGDIGGAAHLRALVRGGGEQAPAQFERGFDLCRLRLADALFLTQLVMAGLCQPGQPAEFGEQPFGHADHVFAATTHA